MSKPAIEFKNVSKSFEVWVDRPYSIKTILANLLRFKFNTGKKTHHQVMSNVTFSVNRGEFVGIMGRNGAGKSTLLKMISKIYRTTSGEIISHGRIAPLLELGAGFASELNGRENVFLNASILGFSRKEVLEKIEKICEFSELGEALNEPVRNYSSGMLVRLGFSIAAHLDAEILLFDEILAVGDIGFQAKCLEKIRTLHSSGKTIILVTHSPEQVEQFCNRCIVIDKHGVAFDGRPKEGANTYTKLF